MQSNTAQKNNGCKNDFGVYFSEIYPQTYKLSDWTILFSIEIIAKPFNFFILMLERKSIYKFNFKNDRSPIEIETGKVNSIFNAINTFGNSFSI